MEKKGNKKTIAEALDEINKTLQRIENELIGINKQLGIKYNYDR